METRYNVTLSPGQSHIKTRTFERCTSNEVFTILEQYTEPSGLRANGYELPPGYAMDNEIEFDPFDGEYHPINGDYSILVETI
jgi:hypothetical protein